MVEDIIVLYVCIHYPVKYETCILISRVEGLFDQCRFNMFPQIQIRLHQGRRVRQIIYWTCNNG